MATPVVAIIETGEELRAPVLRLVDQVADKIRAEHGCQRYEAFTSGRKHVVLLEEWQDGASLTAHAAAAPFATLMAGLKQLGVPAPVVHVLRPVDHTG